MFWQVGGHLFGADVIVWPLFPVMQIPSAPPLSSQMAVIWTCVNACRPIGNEMGCWMAEASKFEAEIWKVEKCHHYISSGLVKIRTFGTMSKQEHADCLSLWSIFCEKSAGALFHISFGHVFFQAGQHTGEQGAAMFFRGPFLFPRPLQPRQGKPKFRGVVPPLLSHPPRLPLRRNRRDDYRRKNCIFASEKKAATADIAAACFQELLSWPRLGSFAQTNSMRSWRVRRRVVRAPYLRSGFGTHVIYCRELAEELKKEAFVLGGTVHVWFRTEGFIR